MAPLSQIEKGNFLKLFNRGGYVLNFSTNDFDVFTMNSVGVAVCGKYNLSKGKSLTLYLNEASDSDAVKLLLDLFDYYERKRQIARLGYLAFLCHTLNDTKKLVVF